MQRAQQVMMTHEINEQRICKKIGSNRLVGGRRNWSFIDTQSEADSIFQFETGSSIVEKHCLARMQN